MPPFRPAVRFAAFDNLERRLLFDAGAIDAAFGDAGVASIPANAEDARLTDVAVTPDGRIVVTGSTAAGTLNVARLHADGSLDSSFGDNGRATSQIGGAQVSAAAVQPDHKIVVVGQREQQFFILRYNTNGKHDRTFGRGGLVRGTFGANLSAARDLAILEDGSIFIAGNATQANGSTAAAVAKFDSSGRLDQDFGDSGSIITKFGLGLSNPQSVFVNRMVVANDANADGDIVLAGRFFNGALAPDADDDALAVMRLDAGGLPDATFSEDGLALADFGTAEEQATGVALDAQGRPVVSIGGAGAFAALRLRTSGSRDRTFGTNGLARAANGAGETHDVLIDDAGQIVLAGAVGESPRLARLLSSGETDDAFGTDGLVTQLPFTAPVQLERVVASPDHTYIAGGTGASDSSAPRFQLGKVFADDAPGAALVSARTLTVPRTGSYEFRVQWRDSVGIDTATIGPRNLRITGPNGFARNAVVAGTPFVRDVTDVVVRYKVPPPNGSQWTAADNGTYTIAILGDGVRNLDGTPAEAGTLGTFRVEIA